jgi:hypothetical protein
MQTLTVKEQKFFLLLYFYSRCDKNWFFFAQAQNCLPIFGLFSLSSTTQKEISIMVIDDYIRFALNAMENDVVIKKRALMSLKEEAEKRMIAKSRSANKLRFKSRR